MKVSALMAVAAQFAAGPNTQPLPSPTKPVAVPGSYSGTYLAGEYTWATLSFFVAGGGTSVLNIAVPSVKIACTPYDATGSNLPRYDHLDFLATAVKPNGAFSAMATQDGVFGDHTAKSAYSLTGRFQRATPAGPASAAGNFKENIVEEVNGTIYTCTSDNQYWTAKHGSAAVSERSR